MIQQERFAARKAFTLIELLIVIAIMSILFSITAWGVSAALVSDQLPSSARTIQSAIVGARDRALQAGKNTPDGSIALPRRGVRFLLETPNSKLVDRLIYVGSLDDWTEGKVDVVNGSNTIIQNTTAPPKWSELTSSNNGVSLVDARIKIKDGAGYWHRLFEDTGTLKLTRPYIGTTGTYDYLLRLPVVPLAGENQLTLHSNVVVDLNRSASRGLIPKSWYNITGAGTIADPYIYTYDQSKMETLFLPNGHATGTDSASGPIYLYLCSRNDLGNDPNTSTAYEELTLDPSNGTSGEKLIVRIIPQSGQVRVFQVSTTDLDADNIADDPFEFAKL